MPGASKIPQKSCSPAPWPANATLEDMDVPRDACCVPRAPQPALGFAPRLGDGDTTGRNPPPCALNLEAINKSTPQFGGPSAAPAPRQSPTTVPEFPSAPAFAAVSPQRAPSAAPQPASRQRGDGDVGEEPGEREWRWGVLAQPFPWPQGQHQAASPLHLPLPSPSSPPPRGHCTIPTSVPVAAALIHTEEVGKGFPGACSGPPAPPIPSQLAQPCLHHPKPGTLHPSLSVQREGKGRRRKAMKNPSRELTAC